MQGLVIDSMDIRRIDIKYSKLIWVSAKNALILENRFIKLMY